MTGPEPMGRHTVPNAESLRHTGTGHIPACRGRATHLHAAPKVLNQVCDILLGDLLAGQALSVIAPVLHSGSIEAVEAVVAWTQGMVNKKVWAMNFPRASLTRTGPLSRVPHDGHAQPGCRVGERAAGPGTMQPHPIIMASRHRPGQLLLTSEVAGAAGLVKPRRWVQGTHVIPVESGQELDLSHILLGNSVVAQGMGFRTADGAAEGHATLNPGRSTGDWYLRSIPGNTRRLGIVPPPS